MRMGDNDGKLSGVLVIWAAATQEVLWAVATRVVGDKDICIIPEVMTSTPLDPCAYDETRLKRGQMTTRVIVDATKPVDLPFLTRITPPEDLWNTMNLKDYLKQPY